MIKCCACKELKNDEEFAWKKKDVRRTTKCKACHKEYRQTHYQNNKQKYIDKAKKWDAVNGAASDKNKQKLVEYLLKNPCSVCGETDPVVLTFDHRDPKEKKYGIYKLVHNGHKWQTIEEEIAKCDVKCYNCHARRTAQQFGWYKLKLNIDNGGMV